MAPAAADSKSPRTPSCPPMAQPTCCVADSMPRISTSTPRHARTRPRAPGLATHGSRARARASVPTDRGPTARSCTRRSSSPSPKRQPHLEVVGGQRRRRWRRPTRSASRRRRRAARRGRGRPPRPGAPGGRRRGGGCGSLPSYSWTRVNVGLVTGSVTSEGPGQPLRERGLARAELADEQDQVAAVHQLGHERAEAACGLHRVGADLEAGTGRHTVTPAAASASLARTKSARIWASGSAPPRRAAAGCNVGMSTRAAEGVGAAPQLADALGGVEQPLAGEAPERHHDGRLDQVELGAQVGAARVDLVGPRVAVVGRPALHHVGDVATVAGDARAPRAAGGRAACRCGRRTAGPGGPPRRPAPRR